MITRVAAAAAIVLAAVVLAVVLVRGADTHRYDLVFESAGQLVKDDDVQIGGRRIGSVRDIELTDDNLARIRIEVQEPYAPLHEGTTAIIRATSLSGVANRYVALTPGPQSNPELDDRATLQTNSTTTIVDLDQLLNTFDDRTRTDLTKVIRSFAVQFDGEGEAAGQAAKYFNPLLSTSRKLVAQLNDDDGLLTDFLLNTSTTVADLAERRGELSSAIANTNTVAGAIAAEAGSLDAALRALPTTLRRGNSTFVNLRSTLDDLDRLVAASKPATRRLAPFLRVLRPLVRDARPTVASLNAALRSPGDDNDLVEATLSLPRLERSARAALRNSTRALQASEPVLAFYRPYAPDLVGWFRGFGMNASTYDANGHYARIAPVANVFSFTDDAQGGTLTPVQPNERLDALEKNILTRCPGAASQEARDGSNNAAAILPEGGCDPSEVPPGP